MSSKRKASTPSPSSAANTPVKRFNSSERMGKDMEDVKDLIKGLAEKFTLMDQNLNQRLDRLEKKFDAWEEEKTEIRNRQDALEARLERMERQTKRNNVVITGLPLQKERPARMVTKEFFKEKLNQEAPVIDAFYVKTRGGTKIVAKMASSDDKVAIMKSKRGASGLEKVYIDDDLTKREEFIQFKARELKKSLKAQGQEAKVGFQKVYAGDKLFMWNEEINEFKERKN